MVAEYGLTSTGFVPKTIDIVRDGINADLRSKFGTSLDLSDEDPLGWLIGVMSALAAEIWELDEAIYNSQSRETATGAALDNVLLLTGTFRAAATSSVASLVLTGTPATLVPSGSQVATASTNIIFALTADATITLANTWATSTPYATDAYVTYDGHVYHTELGGVSGVLGSPETETGIIWTKVGDGTGYVVTNASAVNTGPQVANARDISVIVTPIGGWTNVTNLLDAVKGRNEASDAEARLAGELDLSAPGESTLNAVREELLKVAGVTAVTIFANRTDTTDIDGVPAHSIEAMIEGDVDGQSIANTLFNAVSGTSGIYGDLPYTVTDDQGFDYTVSYSVPDYTNIYVKITLEKYPAEYPSDGDIQVKDAIADYGNALLVGRTVFPSTLGAAALAIPGVLNVSEVLIGTVNPPVASVPLTATSRQKYVFDTTHITIVTSDGTP